MSDLLIAFVIPILVIIFAAVLESLINCPFKVAAISFVILIAGAFILGGTLIYIIFAWVLSFLAFITAFIFSRIMSNCNRGNNTNLGNNNNIGDNNLGNNNIGNDNTGNNNIGNGNTGNSNTGNNNIGNNNVGNNNVGDNNGNTSNCGCRRCRYSRF